VIKPKEDTGTFNVEKFIILKFILVDFVIDVFPIVISSCDMRSLKSMKCLCLGCSSINLYLY
jgi:hypothetical protein